MKNAKKLNFLKLIFSICACAAIMLSSSMMVPTYCVNANEQETVYRDDIYSGDLYDGGGTQVSDNYDVYYDSYTVTYEAHADAPSFCNGDTSKTNYCAPLAGMNVVVFFDRWCDNLISNYVPGMMFGNGTYHYFPDMSRTETLNAFSSLYSLMRTGELGGTTSANFKSGLSTYANNAGYTLSYTSMHDNSTTVDLNKLTNAIDQGKVGLVMCSEYNFVSGIIDYPTESRMKVVKSNSTVPHMMMVYGYQTIAYYKDGTNFRTDTFLFVCSSYGSGETGYMQLNDFLKIDEALIMTIN